MPTFRDQIRVAFDPLFRKQSAYGTARAQAELTKTLTGTAVTMTRNEQKQLFYDCSGQVMRRQEMTSRMRRMTLEMDGPGALVMTGFLAFAAGQTLARTGTDPKVQPIQMMPKPTRLIPVMTLRVGHEDGTSVGSLWKDVAVARAVAKASAGQDSIWKLSIDLIANYSTTAATGTTWPTCIDEPPLKLYDSSLVIDGVERINNTREITLTFDNRPPTDRTPFVAGSLDIQRFFRAARREYSIEAAIEGVEDSTDANFVDLSANLGVGSEVANTVLTIGPAGRKVVCNVPLADWALSSKGQEYDGDADAEEAVLATVVIPKDVEGSADAPLNIAGTIPAAELTQQMLLTA